LHLQIGHRIQVSRSPGNHACQLRPRRRPMQFPYNQTANTDSLYVAPSQRTLVIPYANSMLQARARRARRSNQYCIRKVGCSVRSNNSRLYVRCSHQCAKKYVEKHFIIYKQNFKLSRQMISQVKLSFVLFYRCGVKTVIYC